MSIRAFEAADLSALYDIYAYYVKTTVYNFDLEPMSYSQYKLQIEKIAKEYPIFVACHDEQVIGYAYVHPAFSKAAYRFCMEVTIYFRKGSHFGLADSLLDTLEKACVKKRYRWLIACITDTNHRSITFHQRHGYQWSGSLPECGFKFDTWHGVVWLIKDIQQTRPSYYKAPNATVTGDVQIGEGSSIWFGTVVRGDSDTIRIGEQTNVQDNAVLHCSKGNPLTIGNRVTIGHHAIVHGCTIEDEVLIGMGATIMDAAKIGKHSIIGAGALVPPGKVIPEGSVVLGCPGKVHHLVTPEQIEQILDNAQEYVEYAQLYEKRGV